MNGKLIPVFVLAALMSCSQPPVKEQGPRPVKLTEVTSLNLVEKSFSGVVSPDQFSDLAFKMSGPLISLKVDEGQKVRVGQVVAEIDPQDFKWEYEAKKASFQTAEAQLQRAKKLLSKQAISKKEYIPPISMIAKKKYIIFLFSKEYTGRFIIYQLNLLILLPAVLQPGE